MSQPNQPSTSVEPLGIQRLLGIHYYVRDIERSRRFYVDGLDFAEIGQSSPALSRAGKQRSIAFRAGGCTVVCSTPDGPGGRAHRYLSRHPDGIGTLAFQVEDIHRTFTLLDERGGTPIDSVQCLEDDYGKVESFSITSPFGDTTFRFFQYHDYKGVFPGLELYPEAKGGQNQFRFTGVDHITSNFQTMKPALLWMEHVMGFAPYWDVSFHTLDIAKTKGHQGSGLRSQVMWDPASGVKFANNEPYRPFFKNSQINLFTEEHRGDGVQHVALATLDVVEAVRGLRERGVQFMPTPQTYYEALPERIRQSGIGSIDENIDELSQLEVLVDGNAEGKYLLQIFLKESAGLYQSPEAGPFFYEIIQRKGDDGFGAGNFRALFESIERKQLADAQGGSQDDIC